MIGHVNRFLKIFLIVYFLGCAFIFKTSADEVTDSINQHISALEAKFSIPIMYTGIDPSRGYMHFDPIPEKDYPLLNHYLELFEQEINKYPSGFFSKKRIRAIGLVERLFRETTPAEGLYDSKKQVMMFDILRSHSNAAQQRHSIHHEIFHMMTFEMPAAELLPQNWNALNVPGFLYGPQNLRRSQINPVNRFAPSQLGFVTDYSMQAPQEDQAEIFACLMQKNHYRLVMEWQQRDPYLQRKTQTIKTFVQEYDADMGDGYWEKLNQSP